MNHPNLIKIFEVIEADSKVGVAWVACRQSIVASLMHQHMRHCLIRPSCTDIRCAGRSLLPANAWYKPHRSSIL
jgi:hypothetical protein